MLQYLIIFIKYAIFGVLQLVYKVKIGPSQQKHMSLDMLNIFNTSRSRKRKY